jgi:hypothetical protein
VIPSHKYSLGKNMLEGFLGVHFSNIHMKTRKLPFSLKPNKPEIKEKQATYDIEME